MQQNIISQFYENTPHHHLYCINRQQRIISCNLQQAISCGFTCENAVIGKHLDDLCGKNAIIYMTNNENIFQSGAPSLFIEPTFTADNVTYNSYKIPMRNHKGKVIGVMGMSTPMINNLDTHKNTNNLTIQQKKCLDLLLQGYSLKQIAAEMNLTYKTVEHYLAKIRAKFQCKTTRELILKIK